MIKTIAFCLMSFIFASTIIIAKSQNTYQLSAGDVLRKLISTGDLDNILARDLINILDPISDAVLMKTLLSLPDNGKLAQSINLISGTTLLQKLDRETDGKLHRYFDSMSGVDLLYKMQAYLKLLYRENIIKQREQSSDDSSTERAFELRRGKRSSMNTQTKKSGKQDANHLNGVQKRNFDEMDRSGFSGFDKRNFITSYYKSYPLEGFDELDRSPLNPLYKRNFGKEVSRVNSFFKSNSDHKASKRILDEINRSGFDFFID